MINFGNIYLITKDFEKSLDFYKKLLQKDVSHQNMTRFAIFNLNGLCLAILNGKFDSQNPERVIKLGEYCSIYDDTDKIAARSSCGKCVINLNTDDLRNEYKRISELKIGSNLTKIRYINAGTPYYYFSMQDIDGNTIEITGDYLPQSGELE